MAPTTILGPLLAMILLTFLVWVTMYARRIAFLTREGIDPQDLAAPGELARRSPPAVSNPSDNLKNLFEIPVLFYALALCLYVTERVDAVALTTAWVFVALRALHSLVHCTFNRVIVRFWLYAASALAVWFLAGRLAWQLFVAE